MEKEVSFTDEEIIEIYNNDYINNHIGGTTLKRKYRYNFYPRFKKLGLDVRNNTEKNRKYACDSNYFEIIDNEEKAYWLGFCYADGYIQRNSDSLRFGISLSSIDYNHLEKFKSAINFNGPIHEYEVKQGYKIGVLYCRIIICDEVFVGNLIKHGLIEHKSNIMEAPIGVPKDLEKHFIRGFMDANGSIKVSNANNALSYTISFCSTEPMLDWIQNHLLENSIIARKYKTRKRKEEHIVTQFEFGGNNQAKKYCDYIYENATIYLDRKYNRYKDLCNLLNDREEKILERQNCECAYCKTKESGQFIMWKGDGEYNNKILCNKHYTQLRKYGYIVPDKKNKCDICGNTNGRLTKVGSKFGKEYHGKTLCLKHYNQLMYYGKVLDDVIQEEGNEYVKID